MGSRTWIKIYCDRWLNGTLRDETPEFRGIWIDLLVLAGSGKYGDSGEIKITDHQGFFDTQLAELLQISRQKWAGIKQKLIHEDRVILKNHNIIAIKNWSKYQSEYNRQKPYRHDGDMSTKVPDNNNLKLQPQVTSQSTTREGEGRLEIIEEKLRDTMDPPNPPVSGMSLSKEDLLEIYKDNIGFINEDVENELELAMKRFSAAWVCDAIKEACLQNRRTWRYAVGILLNWERYRRLKEEHEAYDIK
jgi:DnaD/phage-associated family protein